MKLLLKYWQRKVIIRLINTLRLLRYYNFAFNIINVIIIIIYKES